jgi:hypothetical protein
VFLKANASIGRIRNKLVRWGRAGARRSRCGTFADRDRFNLSRFFETWDSTNSNGVHTDVCVGRSRGSVTSSMSFASAKTVHQLLPEEVCLSSLN